jgi:hypothetical protein
VSRWDIKYRTGEVHEFYGRSTGHHGGIHGRPAFPMPMQLGREKRLGPGGPNRPSSLG